MKEKTISDTLDFECDLTQAIKTIIGSFDNVTLSQFANEEMIKQIQDSCFSSFFLATYRDWMNLEEYCFIFTVIVGEIASRKRISSLCNSFYRTLMSGKALATLLLIKLRIDRYFSYKRIYKHL